MVCVCARVRVCVCVRVHVCARVCVYLLSLLLLLFLVHCVFRPECVIVAVWALKRQVTTSTVAKIVKDIYHSAVSLTLVRG